MNNFIYLFAKLGCSMDLALDLISQGDKTE